MKILVIGLSRLGDIIESTSMLKGLKLKYPGCRITYLLQTCFRQAGTVLPHTERVIEFNFRQIYETLFFDSFRLQDAYRYLYRFFNELKQEKFEKIINITPNNIGILSMFLSGNRKNLNGNESDWENFFYAVTGNWHTLPLHFCDMYSYIAGLQPKGITPEVSISQCAVEWAEGFFNRFNIGKSLPVIGFNPGASDEIKRWRKAYFIETGKMILNKYRVHLVLYGSKAEEVLCREIKNGIGHDNVINAAGKTDIDQFAALLRMTRILITNDTGSMHLASACGTRIISIHTGKEKCFSTGPYGEGHFAIQAGLSCHPCNNSDSCVSQKCRDAIEPALVFDVFEEVFNNGNFNRLAGYSNVYQSRIDENGMVDYVPLYKQHLNIETFNRYMLRLMLGCCLSENDSSATYQNVLTAMSQAHYRVDVGSIEKSWESVIARLEHLISLCDIGISITGDLKKGNILAGGIEELKKISTMIEQIDCQIVGKAESVNGFQTLANLFRTEKNALFGEDIFRLSEQTQDIYSKLKFRCHTIIQIYKDFLLINNREKKEVYHEHFSQRNTRVFAA